MDPVTDFRAAVESVGGVSAPEYRAPATDRKMDSLWKPAGIHIEPHVGRVADSPVFQQARGLMLVSYGVSGGWYCARPSFNPYLVDRPTQQVLRARAEANNLRQEMARLLQRWRDI